MQDALKDLGDNRNQNFHLGTKVHVYRRIYGRIFSFTATRKRSRVKRDYRSYIRRYNSPNENFEYGYPHSNALLTFSLQKDSKRVFYCAYVQRLQAA